MRTRKSLASRLPIWVAPLSCASIAAAADAPRYRVEILPAVEGQPSVFSNAINDAGEIIGLAASDRFDPAGAPVRLTSGAATPLFFPPESSFNFPRRVNNSGVVAGVSNAAAFAWSGAGGDPLIPAPGYGVGFAYGLNNVGQFAGSQLNDLIGIELPAYWPNANSEGQILQTGSEPPVGAAFDINNAGVIVGWAETRNGGQPVRWNTPDALIETIEILPDAIGGEALDINENGDVAGRSTFADSSSEAMLYVALTNHSVGLGHLGGNYSIAHALNDARTVVGESSTGSAAHGFVWQNGALYDLNHVTPLRSAPFYEIVGAFGVNNLGQIAADVTLENAPAPEHRAALLIPLRPGDLDGDGDVDITDLSLMLADYACAASNCLGDLDADGDTDIVDIAALLSHYGT